jgi:uncharacterized membrane protein
MFSLPALPVWNAVHPIVVHFPIALMFLTPVLLVLALVFRSHARGLLAGALVTAAIAALAAVLAVASGEAGEDAVNVPEAAKAVLHDHEELGEMTRNIAIGLTVALGVLNVLAARAGSPAGTRRLAVGLVIVLVVCAPASLVVMNTGHQGGRLVHEFGVRAPLAQGGAPGIQTPPAAKPGDDDD